MKKLTLLLTLLMIVTTLNAGTGSPTLYDQVKRKAERNGLNPVLEKIKNDPQWSFKGNKDYEEFIDYLISAAEETPEKEQLQFWEKPETVGLICFILGVAVAR